MVYIEVYIHIYIKYHESYDCYFSGKEVCVCGIVLLLTARKPKSHYQLKTSVLYTQDTW